MSLAYKLLDRAEWEAALTTGRYDGSAVDRVDGYIHLSTSEQLAGTAAKHFRGRSDLAILTVDLDLTGSAVRWEPSRGEALFPHLYGALTPDMVIETRQASVDAEGRLILAEPR